MGRTKKLVEDGDVAEMVNKQDEFVNLAEQDEELAQLTRNFDLVGICLRADELRKQCGINPLYLNQQEVHHSQH